MSYTIAEIHHHHHHHRCILDAGHDPLCSDPGVRDGALLYNRTSQANLSRTCPILLQMLLHWVTSLLQKMDSRVSPLEQQSNLIF